jgi:hypothetical protein
MIRDVNQNQKIPVQLCCGYLLSWALLALCSSSFSQWRCAIIALFRYGRDGYVVINKLNLPSRNTNNNINQQDNQPDNQPNSLISPHPHLQTPKPSNSYPPQAHPHRHTQIV